MFINSVTMNMHIAPNRLISDIQTEFNDLFPFLKLEFFKKKTLMNPDFSAKQLVPSNKRISDCQDALTDGHISIEEKMKVKELEERLKKDFSLSAQVFRKSGNLWLETTITDNWTLQQQNMHGREISSDHVQKEKPEDYDLNRDSSR